MRTLARHVTMCAVATVTIGLRRAAGPNLQRDPLSVLLIGMLFGAGCGQSASPTTPTSVPAVASSASAGGSVGVAAAAANAVTVSISLSPNPATVGDTVTATAHATRATGVDVPAQPGELRIEACLDLGGKFRPAADCNGAAPSAIWDRLNFVNTTPPTVTFGFTAGQAGTIGFRGHYIPKGSGFAGGPGAAVDLVVKAKVTPPPPPPPPPPPSSGIFGVYAGTYTIPNSVFNPECPCPRPGTAYIQDFSSSQDGSIVGLGDPTIAGFTQVLNWLLNLGGGGFTGTPASCFGPCFPSYPVVAGSVSGAVLTFTVTAPLTGEVVWTFQGQLCPSCS